MTSNDHATKSAEASPADDPFATFAAWYSEAQKSEPNDANAMSLATVDGAGLPNVRMVLLKDVDDAGAPNRGFVFYTNFEGVKGREVLANPKVALGFHWKSLRRQIRIRGTVTVVADDEADAYFASRARLSRIGSWARNNPGRSKASSRSKRRSPNIRPSSASGKFRDRRTGRDSVSHRLKSSSGATARFDCTTGSCFAGLNPANPGQRHACIPSSRCRGSPFCRNRGYASPPQAFAASSPCRQEPRSPCNASIR